MMRDARALLALGLVLGEELLVERIDVTKSEGTLGLAGADDHLRRVLLAEEALPRARLGVDLKRARRSVGVLTKRGEGLAVAGGDGLVAK